MIKRIIGWARWRRASKAEKDLWVLMLSTEIEYETQYISVREGKPRPLEEVLADIRENKRVPSYVLAYALPLAVKMAAQ